MLHSHFSIFIYILGMDQIAIQNGNHRYKLTDQELVETSFALPTLKGCVAATFIAG